MICVWTTYWYASIIYLKNTIKCKGIKHNDDSLFSFLYAIWKWVVYFHGHNIIYCHVNYFYSEIFVSKTVSNSPLWSLTNA